MENPPSSADSAKQGGLSEKIIDSETAIDKSVELDNLHQQSVQSDHRDLQQGIAVPINTLSITGKGENIILVGSGVLLLLAVLVKWITTASTQPAESAEPTGLVLPEASNDPPKEKLKEPSILLFMYLPGEKAKLGQWMVATRNLTDLDLKLIKGMVERIVCITDQPQTL